MSETLCLHALRTRLRRRHYDRDIDSLCYTLLRRHEQNATPAALRYHVVDWLDALLAMEIVEGGTR